MNAQGLDFFFLGRRALNAHGLDFFLFSRGTLQAERLDFSERDRSGFQAHRLYLFLVVFERLALHFALRRRAGWLGRHRFGNRQHPVGRPVSFCLKRVKRGADDELRLHLRKQPDHGPVAGFALQSQHFGWAQAARVSNCSRYDLGNGGRGFVIQASRLRSRHLYLFFFEGIFVFLMGWFCHCEDSLLFSLDRHKNILSHEMIVEVVMPVVNRNFTCSPFFFTCFVIVCMNCWQWE